MWRDIEQAISATTGEAFKVCAERAVGGGCINEAVCLEGEQRSYFVKLNQAQCLEMFEAEAAGLSAIAASHSLRVPQPVAWGVSGDNCWLALEFVSFASPSAKTSTLLGERLAAMHRCTAPAFGWDRDNTIGSTVQPNPWAGDWVEFLREQRLGYQLELASARGAPPGLLKRGRQLLERLPSFFEDYQPAPSLLHGDLWGGNWGADAAGEPVIFDPAVYFGDRETDLAMTELFGGFDQRFYRAYESAWPVHPGYRNRKRLYQLYHILNHFNLFGGSYANQAESLINTLLTQDIP